MMFSVNEIHTNRCLFFNSMADHSVLQSYIAATSALINLQMQEFTAREQTALTHKLQLSLYNWQHYLLNACLLGAACCARFPTSLRSDFHIRTGIPCPLEIYLTLTLVLFHTDIYGLRLYYEYGAVRGADV